jgi:ABC-type Fe3+ transport system substrate-binding protein
MTIGFGAGRVLGVVAMSACAVTIAACGSSSSGGGSGANGGGSNWADVASTPGSLPKLVKAAKTEGSLTVVGPLASTEGAALKVFTAKYGVKVDVTESPSSVAGSTVQTQERTGKVTYDMIQTSNFSQLQQYAKQEYLEKYTPQSAGKYPASTEVTNYAYAIGETQPAIAWNTKTTPPAVQKQLETDPYHALLSPALKGKILLLDANVGGSGMGWFANLVYNSSNYGWPYLTKLAAQDPAFTDTITTIGSEITGGTDDVTNFASLGNIGPAAVSGAPVRFVIPSPAAATQFNQAILKGAPHPAAARLFQEWATSLAGQQALSASNGFTSQLPGWKDNIPFISKLPWAKLAKTTYLKWQTDPRLQGDNLTSFLAKWSQVFHHSN